MLGRFMASVAVTALFWVPTLLIAQELPTGGDELASSPAGDGDVLHTDAAGSVDLTSPQPTLDSYIPRETQADRTSAVAFRILNQTSTVIQGEAGRVVQTYGASIPTLVCKVYNICVIELEPGEKMVDTPGWGDSLLWSVDSRIHADSDGAILQQYFFVKPDLEAVETTLVIVTDRRVYSIQLVPSDIAHTPILSFDYPDTRALEMEAQIAADRAAAAARASRAAAQRQEAVRVRGVQTASGAVPAEELTFYQISGNAAFKPLRVYTDGSKTYIQLPPDYRGDVPIVQAIGGSTNDTVNVRYSPNNQMLIVDRNLAEFQLLVGRQQIRIRR